MSPVKKKAKHNEDAMPIDNGNDNNDGDTDSDNKRLRRTPGPGSRSKLEHMEVIDVDDAEALKKARRRQPFRFDPCAYQPKKKKKKLIVTRSAYRSIIQSTVEIKVENRTEGIIKCPSCSNTVITSKGGCNVITCTNVHSKNNGGDGYFYFCYHCKEECVDGISRCSCSRRNNDEARVNEQQKRNERAAENPTDIMDEIGSSDNTNTGINDEEDDEKGPPSYTFFNKVSRPDNLLRRLINDTMAFTESRNSTVIREEDVRDAVATMGFQISPDIDTTEIISKDDPFRGRVSDAFSYTQGDIPIENSALPILKIVEEVYRDTTNFQVVRTPEKQGGTLIKFESPRGVSAKYFEFDWSKVVRKDDNYDYDEENDIDDAEWLTKEDDLIEQEAIQSDDEEEDDDEDDDNDDEGEDEEERNNIEVVKGDGDDSDSDSDSEKDSDDSNSSIDSESSDECSTNMSVNDDDDDDDDSDDDSDEDKDDDDDNEYYDDLWWPSNYRPHSWVVTSPVSAAAAACGD